MARGALSNLAALVALAGMALASCAIDREVRPPDPPATADQPAPGSPTEAPPPDGSTIAVDLFERLNDERRHRGLEALAWDGDLAALARDWSRHLATTGEVHLEHRDLSEVLDAGWIPEMAGLGENLFGATGPATAGMIHRGWMASDSHRANLLEPAWDRVGIAVVCLPGGATFATQNFGRLHDSRRPPPSDIHPPAEPLVRADDGGPSCAAP